MCTIEHFFIYFQVLVQPSIAVTVMLRATRVTVKCVDGSIFELDLVQFNFRAIRLADVLLVLVLAACSISGNSVPHKAHLLWGA